MTETPETDALFEVYADAILGVEPSENVPDVPNVWDHARSLETRLRAAERDAARYRWLRDVNAHTHYGQNHIGGLTAKQKILMAISGDPRLFECITLEVPLAHVPKDGEPIWCRSPDEPPEAEAAHFDFAANLDAAIDAALAGSAQEQPTINAETIEYAKKMGLPTKFPI
jgi:hypothetical protein